MGECRTPSAPRVRCDSCLCVRESGLVSTGQRRPSADTGEMLPGRLAFTALPELPLSFQPHWFPFYSQTLAHDPKCNCGPLLMPQLFVPCLCQALCEVWMTAGSKTDMAPRLRSSLRCGGDRHEGSDLINAHPLPSTPNMP